MKKFGGEKLLKKDFLSISIHLPFKYHSNTPLSFKHKLFNPFN
ncbi:hypothetical protein HMPREF6485_0934 [Segatella buccae ATCC 33574]|uniref:Uncharacterized protein n=2 Tax=Prevotellaceae TaxID=171552 RepID=U2MPA6_9BACT|nr:hypothetical protein HMPREF6485_0934 [Segatella buccae ATCC 33574]EKX87999.1 hypothetical protein HMPREF9999_02157 [Alloprevotella sp. oral taxon 473 str. F0040]ERK01089.1 hypothetical protein HMPREF1218_2178 [Hoylesella pleuritidis F0068]